MNISTFIRGFRSSIAFAISNLVVFSASAAPPTITSEGGKRQTKYALPG